MKSQTLLRMEGSLIWRGKPKGLLRRPTWHHPATQQCVVKTSSVQTCSLGPVLLSSADACVEMLCGSLGFYLFRCLFLFLMIFYKDAFPLSKCFALRTSREDCPGGAVKVYPSQFLAREVVSYSKETRRLLWLHVSLQVNYFCLLSTWSWDLQGPQGPPSFLLYHILP